MSKSVQSSRMETEAVRDLGTFVHSHTTSDADIQDHRSQETVYIGLRVPRSRRHRKRHHRHHRKDESKEPFKTPNADGSDTGLARAATPPSQRIQFLLGEDDEDEEHRAHDMFCEMAELHHVDGESEWKESARWIKFEEDVEEGGDRWSKPHVATLSLHSIFELRCCIMSGTCMLDMDTSNMQQMSDLILDTMMANKQLAEENREKVKETLLSRHRHQHEKRYRKPEESGSKLHLPIIRSLADIGKKYSEPKNLGQHGTSPTSSTLQPSPSFSNSDLPEVPSSHKINMHFMKKIPQGAESANILVGEVDYLNHQVSGFIRLNKAVILGDLTEVPVPTKFVFFLLGPLGNSNKYHEIGRSIATLMSDEIFHDVAYKARNREDLLAGIDEFLDQVTVLPPGEWDPSIRIEPPKSVPSQEARKTPGSGAHLPNGKALVEEEEDEHDDETLIRTGRLFGGLISDVKRKAPFYLSDFTDALHVQSFASFVFLYFACLTPIITFGGLLGDATGENMAAFESILAGAICGIVYALISGQPLTILGSTGPVLVFETILYNFCSEQQFDYLAFRLWIGIWTGLVLFIIVALDLSALVRYITRFTEESFAALISLIFIVEALAKLYHIKDNYPIKTLSSVTPYVNCTCVESNKTVPEIYINTTSLNWTDIEWDKCKRYGGVLIGLGCNFKPYVPDVFFLSTILFFGTFTISMSLKASRNSSFFPSSIRAIISDFAVIIAIISMVLLDALIDLDTPKLKVPTEFKPTLPTRGWVVNPFKNPWWTILAAIIPAMLCTILIFMDQQITTVIVNRKENKLKKGHGYHLDLFVIATLILVCSFLGLPWFVAATVLSITHVMSLKKESQCTAPGESPKFLGVREQRVTGVLVFLMIGISVTLTRVLMKIPMPVLYGVFLYMGVSSLRGMQLVCRVMIIFMPAKYQPDYMYLRHVRTSRVHLFTLIQLICLGILWVIKTIKKISIAFPLMVLAMCFVRKGMDYIFTQRELKWLDDIMPEAHKRAKEDAEKQMQEEEMKLMEGDPNTEMQIDRITISSELDTVNISQEMSKTSIWKTIVASDQSNQPQQEQEKSHKSGDNSKKKTKKHGKKCSPTKASSDDSSLPPIPGSPGAEESGYNYSGSPKKRNVPVKFYIDEYEEKEHLMTAPNIVVEPPKHQTASQNICLTKHQTAS
ncbi:sodium bicarbonate cotransporter 3-like isoform X1 [Octopus vulgaris]|uniref:Anion exchange protein n=1 Tax=Octopus vulgaris TaxID=6645 RepID=A0AA36ASU8_OCTVU|nr:sodium bicarbonate cotransporter 3-like isoform X1 [Octopus vulgaris]